MASHLGVKTPSDPATPPVSDTGQKLISGNPQDSGRVTAR